MYNFIQCIIVRISVLYLVNTNNRIKIYALKWPLSINKVIRPWPAMHGIRRINSVLDASYCIIDITYFRVGIDEYVIHVVSTIWK